MGDLAGTVGQTYRIPRQQPPQYAGAAGGRGAADTFDDGLSFEKNLQEVEGRTEEYYNKVSALKSYMADIHKNLGIDVRVPSMSHPESIRLNRIYQKALADIMHQGNLLKEGQSERIMHINRGDIYTQASNGKADSQIRQGEGYYNSTLPQDITQINDLTQQPSYDDQSYQQKMGVYNKRKGELETEIANTEAKGGNAEALKYSLHGLTPPARAIKQFAPQRTSYQERAAGRKVQAAGNYLKEITNLMHGVSDGYKISKTTANPNKPENPLMVRPNFQDATYNGKHLKEWGYDPKTHEAFMFFDDGTSENVTGQDPLTVGRVMMGSNKATFGVDAEYMDEWADKNGMVKDDGTIDQGKLLRKDAEKIKEQNLKIYNKDITSRQLVSLGKKLDEIQNGTSYLIGTRSKGEIQTDVSPNPAEVYKAKGSGKLYINNFSKVFAKPSDPKKLAGWKAMALVYGPDGDGVNSADMKKFLQRYGAHLHLDKSSTEEGKGAVQAGKESASEKATRLIKEAKGQ